MQFYCSECGSVLNILNERDHKVDTKSIMDCEQKPIIPTGAAVRFAEAIQIEPCKICIEKYSGPARKLMQAFNDMQVKS